MALVYIVQKQMRWDGKKLVPRFNLEPARQYGEFVYLLPASANPMNPDPVLKELHEKLNEFTAEDYLLLVGNPCLIGWATAVAADKTDGAVTLLQWHSREQRYLEVRAEIFEYNI